MILKFKLQLLACIFSGIGAYMLAPSNSAIVDTIEGVNIYAHSTPVGTFTILGNFTVKQKFTGEPKEQLKTALDKLHKDFPTANGLIFTDGNQQQAQAIIIR